MAGKAKSGDSARLIGGSRVELPDGPAPVDGEYIIVSPSGTDKTEWGNSQQGAEGPQGPVGPQGPKGDPGEQPGAPANGPWVGQDGDWVELSTSNDHTLLGNTDAPGSHPQAAIEGRGSALNLKDDQEAQDTRIQTLEGWSSKVDGDQGVQDTRLSTLEANLGLGVKHGSTHDPSGSDSIPALNKHLTDVQDSNATWNPHGTMRWRGVHKNGNKYKKNDYAYKWSPLPSVIGVAKVDTTEAPDASSSDWDLLPLQSRSDFIGTFDTVAKLRTVWELGLPTGHATTLGALSSGDEGGGEWYWDPASTEDDNTGTVLTPNNSTGAGRWKRVVEDAVYLEWFGIKEYPVRITDQWNTAMVWAWKNGINRLTVKSAKNLCLVECGCCSNVEVDLKWSKVYPPPDYKASGGNSAASSRIIGHAEAINVEAGSTIPNNLMGATPYVGDHRFLHPTSSSYQGTLWERLADGVEHKPGVSVITVTGTSKLQAGDRIVIISPIKATSDQAIAEYNIVKSTNGSKVVLEWPTCKYYMQDPAYAEAGIGRFPENSVLENFTLKNAIFPEIQAGANDAYVSIFSSRCNINVTIKDIICNYGRTAWFFVKGARNRLTNVVLDPQGKIVAAPEGLPRGLAFEQGNSYLEVQDSVFNGVIVHGGEGSHFAFRRCLFHSEENPDGTSTGAVTSYSSTGTLFEDCVFSNIRTLESSVTTAYKGHGGSFSVRNRVSGEIGSNPIYGGDVNTSSSQIKDQHPPLTIKDCDIDAEMSSAAFAKVPHGIFKLACKFHIENTKYICRLPAGATKPLVPSHDFLFGMTDVAVNKPMTDTHRLSAFINSSFTCYGDEYGFSRKFIPWGALAVKPVQTVVWNAPGIQLVPGSPDLVWTTFEIENDWNGPSTVWVEAVIMNPGKVTGDLITYTNGMVSVYTAPDTWVQVFTNHNVLAVTLNGELEQRVCLPQFRRYPEQGIMSGNAHFWMQYYLNHAASTFTGTVYLRGFNVYTFGGR